MENLLNQVEPITRQGMLFLANSGGRPLSTVAMRDIAEAAIGLLDASWSGRERVPVAGPDDLFPNDMAQVMSDVLEGAVRGQGVSGEAHTATMLQYGLAKAWAQGLVDVAAAQNEGICPAAPRTLQSTSPTSFRARCEDILKPAVRARGAPPR